MRSRGDVEASYQRMSLLLGSALLLPQTPQPLSYERLFPGQLLLVLLECSPPSLWRGQDLRNPGMCSFPKEKCRGVCRAESGFTVFASTL